MNERIDPMQALTDLLEHHAGKALMAVAPARGGKTEFARKSLEQAMRRFGVNRAVMTVSNRQEADRLGNALIAAMGAMDQARPVTTLPAVAFRIIESVRRKAKATPARLLNGAEQDALLRDIMAGHMAHVQAGDDCRTCGLLRSYFASDDWSDTLTSGSVSAAGTDGSTSAAVLARGISDSFIAQLRDILARMDELGLVSADEGNLIARPGVGSERLGVQWRLAFALRREYSAAVAARFPGEFRLDASRLLVEGASTLRSGDRDEDGIQSMVPAFLVVDDFQDTTLAGLRFLEALADIGTILVLVGNPDEAVQTFRGSHPEYLFQQAHLGPLHATMIRLPGDGDVTVDSAAPDYRSLVASRVSLSIPSNRQEDLPVAARPGKLSKYDGTLPIASLPAESPLPLDGSLRTAVYHSAREELDDVVWQIKRCKIDGRMTWNDMAVIAHDNVTVRLFGERLRRDGVPVRYSSVTRPLKAEPFVQGLFALIELALLRHEGARSARLSLPALASYVRQRVSTLLNGPLVTASSTPGQGRPARMEAIESAMMALEALSGVLSDSDAQMEADDAATKRGDPAQPDAEGAGARQNRVRRLIDSWERLRRSMDEARQSDEMRTGTQVDDHLVADGGRTADSLGFGRDALYLILAFDDQIAPASEAVDAISAVLGRDPQAKALARLWRLVGKVTDGLDTLPSLQPQYALALAWDATGVSGPWQREALNNTAAGRAANDRLDVAMRLFQFAEGNAGGRDVVSFMAQVRSMEIEADSLAHIGPVEQAVTLTTPAGAAGRHWRRVWIPAMQQDVWPNLAERNAMFAGEELAEIVLDGRMSDAVSEGRDPRLMDVLSSEKKSLLVALTRADETVSVSAVWNDDLTPSDFLYGYLPERFVRDRERVRFAQVGAQTGAQVGADGMGLDCDPRGLVAAARVALSRSEEETPGTRDAAAALALLAERGVEDARPDNWNFVSAPSTDANGTPGTDASRNSGTVVGVSPSAVDNLWGCPVCWLLENRFAGPRPSSAATGFGTLIHRVAQLGSEEGLDMPEAVTGTFDERVERVTERLEAIYREQRTDPESIEDIRQRYAALRKDRQSETALRNIASYFVGSNDPEYLGGNAKYFEIGVLTRSCCEQEFVARFDADDILAAWHATPGVPRLNRCQLMSFMGWLVGGWPEGMGECLAVRLSGRIDRLEIRRLADGSETIRLVDYKTGALPAVAQIVNDLQLVCYQLGLAFPESQSHGDAPATMPCIAQSVLFHVEHNDAPAKSRAPEGLFQPPLFTGAGLNSQPFTPRYYNRDIAKLLDMPAMPDEAPEGFEPALWKQLRQTLDGTQTLWSLTMIARVLYAAAASRSTSLSAHPTAAHLKHCRLTTVCPACAGQIDTVFETRQA